MATHTSILAWRIPWTEEPGRLQSIRSQVDTTEVTKHARRQFFIILDTKLYYSPY